MIVDGNTLCRIFFRNLWLALNISACASSHSNSFDTDAPGDSASESDSKDAGQEDSGLEDSDSSSEADAPDYDAIFVEDRLTDWELTVEDEQWILLLADPDVYVEADLTVDGVLYPKVGLRILGKPDRAKVSMRLRFDQVDPNQTFHGVKRVNLHAEAGDTSMIREAMALSLMRDGGVSAPRASFVWMKTNQGSKGVYTLIEQVDKKFLMDRFGEDRGNLYKGERGASLLYLGDDQSLYPDTTYELKTNEDENDRSDLINFTKVLNQSDPNELDDALPQVLDVDGFLTWLAMNTWMVSMDSYAGSVDNYYFYHGADGRFRFIPWDLNQAFGNYHGASCSGAGSLDCIEPMGVNEYSTLNPDEPYCACSKGMRPLIEKVLERPVFQDRYHEILGELISHTLDLERVKSKMQSLRDRIEEAAHLDTQKDCYQPPCTNEIYDAALDRDDPESTIENRVPGLVPFIEIRNQTISAALISRATPFPSTGE
jgi:spore coat protein CotH